MLVMSMQVSAKVWRVNNITGVHANFNNIATAMAAASAGDTLYIEGSPVSYGSITVTKPLTFIGAGYFLTSNPETQAFPSTSRIELLTINAGASGSVFIGITSNGTTAYGNSLVTVNTSNISFIRCHFQGAPGTSGSYRSGAVLRLASGVNNILISSCFIYQSYTFTGSSCSSGCPDAVYAIHMLGNNSGIVVTNNIIKYGSKTSQSSWGGSQYAIAMPSNSSAIFVQNVIIGSFQAYNSSVVNNIQILGGVNGIYITSGSFPNVTQNNIGHSTQFGTTGGNQSSVTMTNVFTYSGGGENVDNHYTLKTGSPALGAGVQGEDCGAFGGTSPMKLSGMPSIPAIYNATVPATGTTSSGININIKSKTHE
jgi:hypothetical protein